MTASGNRMRGDPHIGSRRFLRYEEMQRCPVMPEIEALIRDGQLRDVLGNPTDFGGTLSKSLSSESEGCGRQIDDGYAFRPAVEQIIDQG